MNNLSKYKVIVTTTVSNTNQTFEEIVDIEAKDRSKPKKKLGKSLSLHLRYYKKMKSILAATQVNLML